MIRIASWPHWYEPNPYMRLFYAALEPYGVVHVRHAPLEVRALSSEPFSADVLHLHWPEGYWSRPGHAVREWIHAVRLRRFIAQVHGAGLKVLWTVHNLEKHGGATAADRVAYRTLHRMVDLRLFHSEWSRRVALDTYGGAPETTIVMPHGNYDGVYEPARAGVGRGETHNLLCIGDLKSYKGIDVAIDAMRSLGDEYRLVIAGRPEDSAYTNRVRQACADDSRITLIERVLTDGEFAELVRASDAVLLPYRGITSSGSLLAAFTLERAVLASDLPYFREIVTPEPQAAVLFAAGDPPSLARGIAEFFTLSPQVRGAAARRLADRYRWSEVVKPVGEWLRAHVHLAR